MAFNVNLYTFSKETNSTAVPPANTAATYPCVAIDPMSLAAPVVKILLPVTAQINTFNYMYIGSFNRYYWITDWEYRDRCWFIHGQVDALATFRYQIGETRAYILRSAADYNGTIQDNLYPVRSAWDGVVTDYNSPWPAAGAGYYSVGIVGSGQTNFYVMGLVQLNELLDWMLSDQYAADVLTTLGIAAYPEAKAILDPLQFISSIVFLPVNIDNSYFQTHTLKVGYAEYDLSCWPIPVKEAISTSINITMPKHPYAATRGVYLNAAPYSTYNLFFPPFGLISLDPALCANATSITATVNMDYQTGDATLVIVNNSGRVMSRTGAKVGCPIQLSQVIAPGYGILSAARDAAGIVSGIEGGIPGLIGSGISSVVSGIGNAINGSIPSANTIGSIGTVDAIKGSVQMQAMFALPVQDDLTHRGRPLCDARKISTIPGYIMCADVDIHIAGATGFEMDMIKNAMEGGFYYA